MTKLTDSQIKARDIEQKLNISEGQTVSLSYEEACELSCYLRQRNSLIDTAGQLSTLAARAICYVLSLWNKRRRGEVYPSVRFNLIDGGGGETFYYQRLLDSIKATQDLLKIIDKNLEYGAEE